MMPDFRITKLGLMMEPEPNNPNEVEGTLNPAAVRGVDGELYLFPRVVGKNNYSRIGIARVLFDKAGDPKGVQRLGIALEPDTDYELRPDGTGGCEDPRITYLVALKQYVMTYVALSPKGPRVAMATSTDLLHWQKTGLVDFAPYHGVDFDDCDNKDTVVFPSSIPDPYGDPMFALLHRPHFAGDGPYSSFVSKSRAAELDRKSIWISYCPFPTADQSVGRLTGHYPIARPSEAWERMKIGAGTPPILTKYGWMIVYHGVCDVHAGGHTHIKYSAGVMILSAEDPQVVVYRSQAPLLSLDEQDVRSGAKANVVFPTGIDRREDIGQPDRYDIYYGMGDTRIGAARLDIADASGGGP